MGESLHGILTLNGTDALLGERRFEMSQKVKTWESHVPGCFGGSDHIFAGHPAEEKRAKELRKVCSEQRIPMDDVAKAIERFLKSKKVGDALIQEQVERARKFLKLA